MDSIEAKAYVDRLYDELHCHWQKRIGHGRFMTQLREGTLPRGSIRRFFKDWGIFSVEVVALNAVSYYVHLPFFIRNYDLLPAFTEKIAEELISPKPPGHTCIEGSRVAATPSPLPTQPLSIPELFHLSYSC